MGDAASERLRDEVRTRYAAAARAVRGRPATSAGCCGEPAATPAEPEQEPGSAGCCCGEPAAAFGAARYGAEDLGGLPEEAVLASLGCGNPLAVAGLREGERVLDLGSGGGIDAARRRRRHPARSGRDRAGRRAR